MVRRDGVVKILDFGLVKLMADDGPRLTATGEQPGNLLYASPELLSGDPDLDGRSDLYSVGCLLHHMLVGAPPFPGTGRWPSCAGSCTTHRPASPKQACRYRTLSRTWSSPCRPRTVRTDPPRPTRCTACSGRGCPAPGRDPTPCAASAPRTRPRPRGGEAGRSARPGRLLDRPR
ncbi:protein kinase [Streptomyces sp. NPDC088736]|uniref:protein kinase domain-containing protein n=1 Tax=Streptomyces sp. NPDC088736 TaxID=3365881 RepID=UPI0038116C75